MLHECKSTKVLSACDDYAHTCFHTDKLALGTQYMASEMRYKDPPMMNATWSAYISNDHSDALHVIMMPYYISAFRA